MGNGSVITPFLLPKKRGIPVLMYHEIHPNRRDGLTVGATEFSDQLHWLMGENYQSISLEQFLSFKEERIARSSLPSKPLLLTFDDGYRGLATHALPILQKCHFSACLFVTSGYIEEREARSDSIYLSRLELENWSKSGMEIALHSHRHLNYRKTPIEEIAVDLCEEEHLLRTWQIPFIKALAYPYGARPRKKEALKNKLKNLGIRAAFRIGNRLSSLSPEKDLYEIKRIDIRGTDSLAAFQVKVKKGRTGLF